MVKVVFEWFWQQVGTIHHCVRTTELSVIVLGGIIYCFVLSISDWVLCFLFSVFFVLTNKNSRPVTYSPE